MLKNFKYEYFCYSTHIGMWDLQLQSIHKQNLLSSPIDISITVKNITGSIPATNLSALLPPKYHTSCAMQLLKLKQPSQWNNLSIALIFRCMRKNLPSMTLILAVSQILVISTSPKSIFSNLVKLYMYLPWHQ